MKLMIVSDAWYPQVNGVVRTLTQTRDGLVRRGWQVDVVGPTGLSIACPTYHEIRLTLRPMSVIQKALEKQMPECIHIATEGPLGQAMRRICLREGWKFTTAFHTRFPEYLNARFGVPCRWTYRYLRAFHEPSSRVLAPTQSIVDILQSEGFRNVHLWGRGVDTQHFHPSRRKASRFNGPIYLYVGRLAVEKNVEAFLSADFGEGTKIVVGDGPARASLQKAFPAAVFLGAKHGEELAEIYASADVFVFPSKTDTFGLVILEALASGTPVVAYNVPGPIDVLCGSAAGVLCDDLAAGAKRALRIERHACREFAENNSWDRSVQQFASSLEYRFGWNAHQVIQQNFCAT